MVLFPHTSDVFPNGALLLIVLWNQDCQSPSRFEIRHKYISVILAFCSRRPNGIFRISIVVVFVNEIQYLYLRATSKQIHYNNYLSIYINSNDLIDWIHLVTWFLLFFIANRVLRNLALNDKIPNHTNSQNDRQNDEFCMIFKVPRQYVSHHETETFP